MRGALYCLSAYPFLKATSVRATRKGPVLTQSFAALLQPTGGLFNIRQRKALRSKRDHSPQATGSSTEEQPPHDVPCTMGPRLLFNVR